jgi:hypothetical protein
VNHILLKIITLFLVLDKTLGYSTGPDIVNGYPGAQDGSHVATHASAKNREVGAKRVVITPNGQGKIRMWRPKHTVQSRGQMKL